MTGSHDLIPWLVVSAQNVAMGMALILIYNFIRASFRLERPRGESLIVGIIFGCGALASMSFPVRTDTGLSIDARSIFLLVGSLFGGPVGGVVAGVPATLYRLFMGGPAVVPGVAAIIVTSVFGSLVGLALRGQVRDFSAYTFLGIGLANTALIAFVSLGTSALMKSATVPMESVYSAILVFPVGVMLLAGAMSLSHYRLRWRARQGQAEARSEGGSECRPHLSSAGKSLWISRGKVVSKLGTKDIAVSKKTCDSIIYLTLSQNMTILLQSRRLRGRWR